MLRVLSKAGVGVGLLALLLASPGFAQESNEDLKKDIEALKQGQKNIQRQLAEIKRLVAQSKAPPARQGPKVKDVVFNLGNNAVKGDSGAKLTLIEFTDYQ